MRICGAHGWCARGGVASRNGDAGSEPYAPPKQPIDGRSELRVERS